jgi:heme/copper-type cytochrome/quinol oxidase subunit 3
MSASPIATTRTAAGMPTGRLAVWWVIASEIVIFGGLLGSYIMFRLSHDAFAEQAAHTNTWIGAVNTLVLLTSSLFAVLGHKAADAGDGPKAANFLYLTAGGGLRYPWPWP